MLTTEMFLTTVAPQTDVLLSIGAGAITAMVAFLALAMAAVLGTVQETRRAREPIAAPALRGAHVAPLAA